MWIRTAVEGTIGTCERPRVGAVGAGYWRRNLNRASAASSVWDGARLCDQETDVAFSRVTAVPMVATDSPEEVLADPQVDVVARTTPDATHHDLALAALEVGKHVLVDSLTSGLDGFHVLRFSHAADGSPALGGTPIGLGRSA